MLMLLFPISMSVRLVPAVSAIIVTDDDDDDDDDDNDNDDNTDDIDIIGVVDVPSNNFLATIVIQQNACTKKTTFIH